MVQSLSQTLTLQEFLAQPETKPASEYISGKIIQKPMPKGRHSRLQGKLCAAINQVSEDAKIAYAFPELRCSFGVRSIVQNYFTSIEFLKTGSERTIAVLVCPSSRSLIKLCYSWGLGVFCDYPCSLKI